MDSIDTFINTPLLISAGIGVLLFVLLIVIKMRNTAKSSFIFYVVTGITVVGALITLLNQHFIYFVFALILAELVLLPYLIIKAFDNPQKREEKQKAKKLAEQNQAIENSEAVKAVISEIEANNLYVRQYTLTGESDAIKKTENSEE